MFQLLRQARTTTLTWCEQERERAREGEPRSEREQTTERKKLGQWECERGRAVERGVDVLMRYVAALDMLMHLSKELMC